jgi:uncharacterized membrane protein
MKQPVASITSLRKARGGIVARVFLSDVWKLDALYQILSFMALGVVLLALGFIYNKYQEKIRQWL